MKYFNFLKKNKYIIFAILFSFIFFFYINHYINFVKVNQSYFLHNMIDSLKDNDKVCAKFYAKKILDLNYSDNIYSDLAFLFIYYDLIDKNKEKKIFKFCENIISKKKRVLLNDIIKECNELFYKSKV